MNVPILQIPEEVKALFVNGFARCKEPTHLFEKDEVYPARVITDMDLVYTADNASREVYNTKIKVEDRIFTTEEFIKYFETPDVPCLETKYPEEYRKFRQYVQAVFDRYPLKEYEFQLHDISVLLMMDNFILSPDQGMGKSLISLIWAKIKRILDPTLKKVLIVGARDLYGQWKNKNAALIGINLKRINKDNRISNESGYYYTHFEFIADYPELFKDFDIAILDEGHKIKSKDSKRGKAIRSLQPRCRIPISGTPIKSMLQDLHFIVGWAFGFESELYPYKEDEQYKFRKDFGVYETTPGGRRKLIPAVSKVDALQLMLAPGILRREAKDLISIEEHYYRIGVEFTPEQKSAYTAIENSDLNPTTKDFELGKNTVLYPGNKKLELVERLAYGAIRDGEQFIIAAISTEVCAYLVERFKGLACLANSHILPDKREKVIEAFKRGDFPILVGGVEAINSGHDLYNCSRLAFVQYPWTATAMDQMSTRIRRLISIKDIHIFMPYTIGSIDERILKRVDQKRETAELVMDNEHDYKYHNIKYSEVV